MTRRHSGFTLIELLTVLAIGAILAMLAAPSFVQIMATQKLKAAASNLQVSLIRARSEGLKQNTNVQMVPATANQWTTGWTLVNPTTNAVIASYPPVSSLTITGPATVTYQASGRITATASPTFKVSSPQIADVRCVSITLTGVANVSSSGC